MTYTCNIRPKTIHKLTHIHQKPSRIRQKSVQRIVRRSREGFVEVEDAPWLHLFFAYLLLNLASFSLLEFCNKPAGQFWEACKAMGQIYISILIEMYKQIVRESMILMPRNSQNRPKSCPVAFGKRPWKQVGSRLRFADALRMLPVSILVPLQ